MNMVILVCVDFLTFLSLREGAISRGIAEPSLLVPISSFHSCTHAGNTSDLIQESHLPRLPLLPFHSLPTQAILSISNLTIPPSQKSAIYFSPTPSSPHKALHHPPTHTHDVRKKRYASDYISARASFRNPPPRGAVEDGASGSNVEVTDWGKEGCCHSSLTAPLLSSLDFCDRPESHFPAQ